MIHVQMCNKCTPRKKLGLMVLIFGKIMIMLDDKRFDIGLVLDELPHLNSVQFCQCIMQISDLPTSN